MLLKMDPLPQLSNPDRRELRLGLGPLSILTVTVGHSSTVVGKFYGRLYMDGQPRGYLWLNVRLLRAQVIHGCWQVP